MMSVPGVGPLVALSYLSAIEDPTRFASSRRVAAHLGLVPRRWQSGEMDRQGRISRCGDGMARTMLFEAANVIFTRVRAPCRRDPRRGAPLRPRRRDHALTPPWIPGTASM